MTYINMILYIVATMFVGWNVLALFNREKMPIPEEVSLSFLLGAGVISLQMFLIGLLGWKFSRTLILLPWMGVFGLNIFMERGFDTWYRKRSGLKPLSRLEKLFVWFISFEIVYTFFRALIKPIESYDAVSIHALKAKILYLAGTVPQGFFSKLTAHFPDAHADYPLFLPLSQVWFYLFSGGFNDILVKIILPLSFTAFLVIFYYSLKRSMNPTSFRKWGRLRALIFTFILASVAQFNAYATVVYADIFIGIFYFLSFIYLCYWIKDNKKKSFLWISLAFSVLCVWTKNEGVMLAAINLFILLIYRVRARHAVPVKITPIRFYTWILLGSILIWKLFCLKNGLVNENFNLSMVTPGNFISGLKKLPIIIYEYQKHIFGFKKWNLVWIAFLALPIMRFKKIEKSYTIPAIALFFLGYTFVYIFSLTDVGFLLHTTLSRFLLHILPVAVFFIAENGKSYIY